MSKRIAAAILTSCFLVACGGGNEANTSKDTPKTDTQSEQTSNSNGASQGSTGTSGGSTSGSENQPPTVIISGEGTVKHGSTIELSANASDEDGDELGYQWLQLSGPATQMTGNETLKVTLPEAPTGFDEVYRFTLIVTDPQGAQAQSEFEFIAKSLMDKQQAAKLLHRAGMGPVYSEILAAEGMSAQEWLEAQIELPITYHLNYLENYPNREFPRQINRIDAWWKANIAAPDQLRQRVAYALSQILVVSDFNNALGNEPKGMVNYYDMLLEHAFGNYRSLLEAVSLSPVMGVYLDHLGNEKADTERNIRPDENYARELLQLFSLGLNELNLDGTAKRDDTGLPIPAYTQDHIEGFAKVFTGWTYGGSEFWNRPSNNHSIPMSAFVEYHSTAPKQLLNDVLIPENTGPEESLKIALDTIFAHPNIAPFVSKQLILKLVTSNPTPAYVERVANVFNDNGEGVKGDMAAVIKAIYLDAEAQQLAGPLEYFGKVKEPLIKQMHLWRVFDAKSLLNRYYTWDLPVIFGQGPLQATSVFNFYQPDHQPQELSSTSLVAPELQIANDAFAINILNNHFDEVSYRIAERYDELNENRIYLYMQEDLTLLSNFGLNAVIDKYNTLFFAGSMSEEMRQAIYDMDEYFSASESHLRLSYILFLITVSAEYSLQQ